MHIVEAKISKSEQAYRRIKDLVITCQLAPGLPIDEKGLSQELGIGRTPIREAMLQLAGEGFLENQPGRGHAVKAFGLDDIRAFFEALLLTERAAAYLAAKRCRPGQLEEMKAVNAELKKAMTGDDYLTVTRLNSRLHRLFYKTAGNPFLYTSLDYLQGLSQRLAYLCFANQRDRADLDAHNRKVSQDHDLLIDMLEKRDGPGLLQVIDRHVELFHFRVSKYTSPDGLEKDLLLPS